MRIRYTTGRKSVYIRTSRPVFGHVSPVDSLREHRRVVIDVLEVHLDVGVANQSLAAFVLREHGEPPLRSTVGLISVQRLRIENRFLNDCKNKNCRFSKNFFFF